MEGWKDGRMEGWKDGRMEGWKNGRMEEWKNGRMEEWKNGRMEEWKNGRMEEWKNGSTGQRHQHAPRGARGVRAAVFSFQFSVSRTPDIASATFLNSVIPKFTCLMVHGSLGAMWVAECGLLWCPDGAKEYSPGQRPISAKIRENTGNCTQNDVVFMRLSRLRVFAAQMLQVPLC